MNKFSLGKSKLIILGSVLFLSSLFFGGQANAAVRSWSGGGDGIAFESTSNWTGGVVPTSADTAIIGTTANNIVISASTTVTKIVMSQAFTGSLSLASGVVVTTTGEFTLQAGTLNVTSNNTINIGSTFGVSSTLSMNGGILNLNGDVFATSTVSVGGGVVNFVSSSAQTVTGLSNITFNTLNITSGANTVTFASSVTTTGDITIASGNTLALGTNNLVTSASILNSGSITQSSAGTVTMNGSSKYVGGSGNTTFYNLVLTDNTNLNGNVTTTNNLTVGSNLTGTSSVDYYLVVGGDLTVSSAMQLGSAYGYGHLTMTGNGKNFTLGSGSVMLRELTIASGATTTLVGTSKTLTITNTSTVSGILNLGDQTTVVVNGDGASNLIGSGTVNTNTSTVTFGGTSQVVPSNTYYNLSFTGSGTDTFGGSVTTTNFTENASGLTINPNVNLVITGNFTNTAGALSQTSGTTTFTGVANITGGANTTFKNLIFSSGTSTVVSRIDANNITINTGAVLVNTSSVIGITGNGTPFVINGTFTVSSSTSSGVYYTGSTYNLATTTYYNLVVGGVASLNGDITVYNTISGTGSLTQSTGTVNMQGNNSATSLGADTSLSLYNLTVATTTLSSNITVSNVLTVNKRLTLGSYTLTLSATGTPFVNNGGSGALVGQTGTITYSGSEVNVTGGLTYTALRISSASSTLLGDVTTTYMLRIDSGKKLTATGRTITTETLQNNSGTFVQSGSGTLVLNGNAAGGITGSNGNITLYDLVVNGTGVALGVDVTTTHTFTINTSKNIDLQTSIVRLTGTGTPLVVNGTLTASTSTVIYSGATANIATTTFATLTLSSGGEYTLSGNATSTVATVNNGTLNIGDYNLVISSGDYTNNATTTESGTGRVKKAATGGLTETSYTSGSGNGTGNTISISVTDPTANLLAGSVETKTITITGSNFSDSETVTLTETGAATGIFTGTIPFNIANSASSNGKADVSGNGTLTLSYSNGYGALSGSGTSASYTGSSFSSGGGVGGGSSPSVSSATSAASVTTGSQTNSQNITLNFSVTNAAQVAISEDPGFAGASWDTYSPSKSFTLSSGAGLKTVYVKFRSNSGGVTSAYKVNVNLNSNYVAAPKTEPSTSAVVTLTAPKFEVSNPESKVVFVPLKTLVYKPNTTLKYTYSYKNETTKTAKVKVVRQVLDANGKVVTKATGSVSIAKGKTFKTNVTNVLNSKLADGVYTVKVQIVDFKAGTVLEENSFDITVKKPAPVVKKPVVKAPVVKKK